MDYALISIDPLTELAKSKGIDSWCELTSFVKGLPYGRNSNRTDFSLVISEEKGSCSSKHALLKQIADLNQIPKVKLILGLYKMNQSNTPKIGAELSKRGIDFIPEAHCYLQINQTKVDFTSNASDFDRIKNDIILEREIHPEQVSEFKVEFHKNHIRKWLVATNSEFQFDQMWKIREHCIACLSKN